ncbi:MAG: FABP family protein, partial [Actinomycetota bacterium]
SYREEVTFSHSGRPFLHYLQRTWSLKDGAPMHTETGYWRPKEAPSIELVLAHGFGSVEVATGRVEGQTVSVTSRSVVGAPSADRIDEIARRITVDGDVLAYEVDMAAVGQPLQHHLSAELKRVID